MLQSTFSDRPYLAPTGANHHGTPATRLLKERAYEELKLRILRNDYPPGSFLAERQLAAQLGMSKTPVKAALDRLAHEGFISVSPQQGIVVRDLTFDEIADQYEIRLALEGFALRSMAGRLTPPQIERLDANLVAQEENAFRSDNLRAALLDAEFHLIPSESLGNQEILRVLRQLVDKMHRVILRVFQMQSKRMSDSLKEHRELAQALIRGEGDHATQLLSMHLDRGRRLILDRGNRSA